MEGGRGVRDSQASERRLVFKYIFGQGFKKEKKRRKKKEIKGGVERTPCKQVD